ncbi:MAG TPA: MGMT family protein [Bryobacteraceae bacterium]
MYQGPKLRDKASHGGQSGRLQSSHERDSAFRRVILSIPKGKVATYGQVAELAGYPRHHRAVAHFLRVEPSDRLPWQRVLGAGGEIKLPLEAGAEQRLRLQMEGVTFRGKRVNMQRHGYFYIDKAKHFANYLP